MMTTYTFTASYKDANGNTYSTPYNVRAKTEEAAMYHARDLAIADARIGYSMGTLRNINDLFTSA